MSSKIALASTILFLFVPITANASELIHSGDQCYAEDLSKAGKAAVCVAALRASGKEVTEGDVMSCNIQTHLLTPVTCPAE